MAAIKWREPKVLVRIALGILLAANLVAACYALHPFGDSPSTVDARLVSAQTSMRAAQQRLFRSTVLAANMDKSREQGDVFLAKYLTTRRKTYSTVIDEINKLAASAGIKMGDQLFALPDPIEGSEDLDMLTITAAFEGTYAQLVKLVNLLDRSPKFLTIDGLQVTPQPKGDLLNVTVKFAVFVRDDRGAQ